MRGPLTAIMVTGMVASCLIACTSTQLPAPDMSPQDAEALYMRRYQQYATGETGIASYDTLVPLRGARKWKPLSTGHSIPQAALAKARDYAAAGNSSAFMVWHQGTLVEQAYFGGPREDTPIISKSLSKPLAVIAVGRAMAAGKIASLDQPMADFISEWRRTPRAAITIRQVLGMRSGLLPQGAAPDPADILNRAYLHPFHDRIIVDEYPLVDAPGRRYEYSNANGELVAPLIERATGVPYEDWIAREVLGPIGARGGWIWMNRPGGMPHSGCCALLPAESYLRLGILLARDGTWDGRRLLPKGFVKAMVMPTAENPHAGLGVYIGSPYMEWRGPANPQVTFGRSYHSAPYAAPDLFLFDGNASQVVYIVPSRQLVILRTGDRPPASPVWDNAMLPNIVLDAITGDSHASSAGK
ncbi:MAG: serine hydrolase [Novosphingobium sp.]